MKSSKGKTFMTGKLGNTVTYLLNGDIITRTIGITDKKPTVPQLAFRQKTKVIAPFLADMMDVVNIGFKQEAKRKHTNPQNEAFSYNRLNAVKGDYPDIEMDYPNVLLSIGLLAPVCDPVISITATGLSCLWNPGAKDNKTHWSDTIMLIAYCPELRKMEYLSAGAERHIGTGELYLHTMPHGHWLETYVSVISSNHKNIGNSVYTGRHFW